MQEFCGNHSTSMYCSMYIVQYVHIVQYIVISK